MTKHSTKKGKRITKSKKAKHGDVDSILEQAMEAMNNVQLDEAAELYERALQMKPTDTNIMDALADVHMQLGNSEKAMNLLQQSIAAAPNENGVKWLYLAQLICGNDALSAYQMGLHILESQLQQNHTLELACTIAGGYCSIAELFMTDLCFEENAEQRCESAVMKSLSLNPSSIDARQALASLRISQCRKEDACLVLHELFPPIAAALNEYRSRNIVDEMQGKPMDANHVDFLPSLETAISLVKLYMECSGPTNQVFHDHAHELLEYVLDIDDENPDLWYLMGINANNRVPCDEETARDSFSTAKTMLEEMIERSPSCQDAIVLLRKVKLAFDNVGVPDIHEYVDKLESAQVVGDLADIVKDRNIQMVMEEEWSDDES